MAAKWEKCQELEQAWWLRWKARTDLAAIKQELAAKAGRIKALFRKYLPGGEPPRILQIGPAANGEIHFLEGSREAIDPLAPFFIENFPGLMDPAVNYRAGKGEALPYPDRSFNAVLILNVLDHCADPLKVLREIGRVLRPGGLLLLQINTYPSLAALAHRIFGFLDREHPHAITQAFLDRHLGQAYDRLETIPARTSLPEYDPVKKLVLWTLMRLRLAPSDLTFVARKR